MSIKDCVKKETIAEWFEDFAEASIPDEVPPRVYTFMERTFYAGVWCLLEKIKSLGFDDTVSDADFFKYMEEREAEMNAFSDKVREGVELAEAIEKHEKNKNESA